MTVMLFEHNLPVCRAAAYRFYVMDAAARVKQFGQSPNSPAQSGIGFRTLLGV